MYMTNILQILILYANVVLQVVCVGVTCARYVSLNHARPWLVHAYRNIKGRGLHAVEEGSNAPPMEQDVENTAIVQHEETQKEQSSGTAISISATEEDKVDVTVEASDTLDTKGEDKPEKMDVVDMPETVTLATQNIAEKALESQDVHSEGSAKRRRLDIGVEQEKDSSSTNQSEATDFYQVNKTGAHEINDQTVPDTRCSEATEEARAVEESEGRAARKRKLPEDTEPLQDKFPPAPSTYDRVRLIIQPWRKPEGGINKPIFKMMLESVMLFFMMKPGSGETSLINRYKPYVQPMVLRNIVNILVDIGCLTCQNLRKPKVSLFSKFNLEETEEKDEEDVVNYYLPTEECLFKLGHFGKEMFPKAKWPDSTVLHG